MLKTMTGKTMITKKGIKKRAVNMLVTALFMTFTGTDIATAFALLAHCGRKHTVVIFLLMETFISIYSYLIISELTEAREREKDNEHDHTY